MIWILGGTSESVELLERIRGKLAYIVSVATESGKERLPVTDPVRVGRLSPEQMREFITGQAIELVVDLTHPYATEVTRNVRQVCRELQLRCLRYVRESSEITNAVRMASIEECAAFLQELSGCCVFFSTGSKNIGTFQQVRGTNRFVYRILPASGSLEECVSHHVEMKDIVAALGPFSEAMNIAMFKEYQAEYVVMKDSGRAGGTPQKIAACERLGITPVLLLREDESGFTSLEELEETILNLTDFHRT
ncbi:MAG: precorrin-6A reductase [bacterium]|nr:precorrin-6A reductase [bacterium]